MGFLRNPQVIIPPPLARGIKDLTEQKNHRCGADQKKPQGHAPDKSGPKTPRNIKGSYDTIQRISAAHKKGIAAGVTVYFSRVSFFLSSKLPALILYR
jgi:hypothetical protein